MISEKEFNALQGELAELGQEVFSIKDDLEMLQQKNEEISKLKAKLSEIENRREEERKKHEENMICIEEKLKAEESQNNPNKKIEDINQKIQILENDMAIKQSGNEGLRKQIVKHRNKIMIKRREANKLKKQIKIIVPYLRFTNKSKGASMFVEELELKNHILRNEIEVAEKELNDLDEDVTKRHRDNDETDKSILEKVSKIKSLEDVYSELLKQAEEIEKKSKDTHMKISEMPEKVKTIQKEINDSNKIYNDEIVKLEKQKQNIVFMLNEELLERDKLKKQLESNQKETETKNQNYTKQIQELRRKLTNLKNYGFDEDSQPVDRQLQFKINELIDLKNSLNDKTNMLSEATNLVKSDLIEKEQEIQKRIFKKLISNNVLSKKEIHAKRIQLDDIILQNKGLREAYSDLTNQLLKLQEENLEIRNKIKDVVI